MPTMVISRPESFGCSKHDTPASLVQRHRSLFACNTTAGRDTHHVKQFTGKLFGKRAHLVQVRLHNDANGLGGVINVRFRDTNKW